MQESNNLPIIGITMGDPSGVGPEIIFKSLRDKDIYELCIPVVIGDKEILLKVMEQFPTVNMPCLNLIKEPGQAIHSDRVINLISLSSLKSYTPGIPSIDGGKAMVAYIEYAVRMALNKSLDAIVTCPINKSLMYKAGFPYDGHTPFIAHLTNTKDYVMMLAGKKLKVTLVTIHVALKDVPPLITEERVKKTILITADALVKDFGIESPKIAVSGLNPHAGEEGLFGNEEDIISKAMEGAKEEIQKKGYKVTLHGPLPPDTVYYRATKGEFDVVVSMYHDQGLIPLKLLHFSDAVNITLGLPIVRTSVDHGTGYDIAGKGIADESSLKSAIKMAVLVAENRNKIKKGLS